MVKRVSIALCQMQVKSEKQKNIEKACSMIREAVNKGAELIVLPEMFNCPYDNNQFEKYAESMEDGNTLKAISEIAGENGVYISAGSIPEYDHHQLYNTSAFIDRNGKIIAKHRKIHLFDIDVKDKIRFKESDVLSAGRQITIVETDFCKIGIAICFDIRFPELFRIMALNGAKMMIVPGAFNMVTGPAHWEMLIKARAVDNQVYIAAASPARDQTAGYVAYGNSMVVDPWGNIVSRATDKEEIIFADVNLNEVDRIRDELPILKNRRTDLYEICTKRD